jgi:hypothetical protein
MQRKWKPSAKLTSTSSQRFQHPSWPSCSPQLLRPRASSSPSQQHAQSVVVEVVVGFNRPILALFECTALQSWRRAQYTCLNETRAIGHSHEIHTGTTVDVDRYYDNSATSHTTLHVRYTVTSRHTTRATVLLTLSILTRSE